MAASAGHSGTSSNLSEGVTDGDTSNAEHSGSSESFDPVIAPIFNELRQQQQTLLEDANDHLDAGDRLAEAGTCLEDYIELLVLDMILGELLGETAEERKQARKDMRIKSIFRRVYDSKRGAEAEEGAARRGLRPEEQEASNTFESVVQHANAGSTDYKHSRWPHLKQDGELKPRYFNAYKGTVEHRLMKQVKRWQVQHERYGVESARNWRSALDLLDRATPDGETRHKRRMETVRMEKGVQATWKKAIGEVVLELMQRTGAHMQVLPSSGGEGTFNSVSLWGTPAQNEHARLILPQFVEAADAQHRPLNSYELKSEVARDVAASFDAFGSDFNDATDTAYWREQEMMDDAETEQLEDALGDITNAPPRAPIPARSVWAPSKVHIRSRPRQWNQLTFSAYVDALTQPVPRLAQRKLYGAQKPASTQAHVENALSELVRVFTVQHSRDFASAAALDTALQFFTKHNNFAAIRRVFVSLEERQFDFTASNYNSLFEAAAREESVPNFLYTLRGMLGKGIRPTARTWTAFHLLMSRRFPLESNVVSEAMRRKGFFGDMDTVKAISAGNVDRLLVAHLATGKSVESFLLSCEDRYGDPANWLSARFANKGARVLLEKGRTEDALNLVRRLEATAREKGRQGATTSTLNIFLSSTLRDDNIGAALSYMRLFMPPPPSEDTSTGPVAAPVGRFPDDRLSIQPNHITLGTMHVLAWHNRYYNVARVIWRHACASGQVSFPMQESVRRSLRRQVVLDGLSSGEVDLPAKSAHRLSDPLMTDRTLWNAIAGKFVAGVSEGLDEGPKGPRESVPTDNANAGSDAERLDNTLLNSSDVHESSSDAIDAMSASTLYQPASRESRARRASAILEDDLQKAGFTEPVGLLLHDLERAWRLDMTWKEEGLGKMKGVRERAQGSTEERKGGIDAGRMPLKSAILHMFDEMLRRGVRVPMQMGDAAGVNQMEGLVGARYQR